MTEEELIIEHSEEDEQSDVIKWISAGFGIGLLVGGIVGLLLAPKTGKDNRAQLREFTGELSTKTKTLAKDLGEKAKDLGDKAKDVGGKVGTHAKDFGEKAVETKDVLSESYKAGKAKYDELKTDD